MRKQFDEYCHMRGAMNAINAGAETAREPPATRQSPKDAAVAPRAGWSR